MMQTVGTAWLSFSVNRTTKLCTPERDTRIRLLRSVAKMLWFR